MCNQNTTTLYVDKPVFSQLGGGLTSLWLLQDSLKFRHKANIPVLGGPLNKVPPNRLGIKANRDMELNDLPVQILLGTLPQEIAKAKGLLMASNELLGYPLLWSS